MKRTHGKSGRQVSAGSTARSSPASSTDNDSARLAYYRKLRRLVRESFKIYPTKELRHRWVRAKLRLGDRSAKVKLSSEWQYDRRYFRFS